MLNPTRGPHGSTGQVNGSPMGIHKYVWMAGGTLPFLGFPNTSVTSQTKERGRKLTPAATNVKGYKSPNTHPAASGYALYTLNQPFIPILRREVTTCGI